MGEKQTPFRRPNRRRGPHRPFPPSQRVTPQTAARPAPPRLYDAVGLGSLVRSRFTPKTARGQRWRDSSRPARGHHWRHLVPSSPAESAHGVVGSRRPIAEPVVEWPAGMSSDVSGGAVHRSASRICLAKADSWSPAAPTAIRLEEPLRASASRPPDRGTNYAAAVGATIGESRLELENRRLRRSHR